MRPDLPLGDLQGDLGEGSEVLFVDGDQAHDGGTEERAFLEGLRVEALHALFCAAAVLDVYPVIASTGSGEEELEGLHAGLWSTSPHFPGSVTMNFRIAASG